MLFFSAYVGEIMYFLLCNDLYFRKVCAIFECDLIPGVENIFTVSLRMSPG